MTATVTPISDPMRQAMLVEKIHNLTLYDELFGRAPNGWRVYRMIGPLTTTVCSGSLQAVLGWLEEREL